VQCINIVPRLCIVMSLHLPLRCFKLIMTVGQWMTLPFVKTSAAISSAATCNKLTLPVYTLSHMKWWKISACFIFVMIICDYLSAFELQIYHYATQMTLLLQTFNLICKTLNVDSVFGSLCYHPCIELQ
jgi:hypothetical protein